MTIEAVIRRLIERIDTLPVEDMDSVDAARRAALELWSSARFSPAG